ncbi:hypothetical protein ATN84_05430 [Paramesorhizobium deserti]|uniref:Uncharacterized protein n=1 Tax=Paramesorhizobium deserti TaxID=1494590 RepID=A0A135I144_9HYPH|nr:hypothetical protein ATN84_05430 [Paramesorhizobium deserti]
MEYLHLFPALIAIFSEKFLQVIRFIQVNCRKTWTVRVFGVLTDAKLRLVTLNRSGMRDALFHPEP